MFVQKKTIFHFLHNSYGIKCYNAFWSKLAVYNFLSENISTPEIKVTHGSVTVTMHLSV